MPEALTTYQSNLFMTEALQNYQSDFFLPEALQNYQSNFFCQRHSQPTRGTPNKPEALPTYLPETLPTYQSNSFLPECTGEDGFLVLSGQSSTILEPLLMQ